MVPSSRVLSAWKGPPLRAVTYFGAHILLAQAKGLQIVAVTYFSSGRLT